MIVAYSDCFVSVVVPSFNGLDKLKILLPALNSQSCLPYEVVVVVDGSQDGSFEWLSKNRDDRTFRFTLNIIYQENQGRGSSKANGADAAKGSIILFCDDDMIVSSQWVQSHVNAHISGDVITGPVRLCRKSDGSREFFDYFSFLIELWDRENRAKQYSFFSAQNVSFKRSVYESTGGFDRSLRDAEDRDYAIRLNQLGVIILYVESCLSYTVPYKSFKDYSNRLLQYREGNRILQEKIRSSSSTRQPTIMVRCRRLLAKLKRFPPFRKVLVLLIESGFFMFLSPSIRYNIYTLILF